MYGDKYITNIKAQPCESKRESLLWNHDNCDSVQIVSSFPPAQKLQSFNDFSKCLMTQSTVVWLPSSSLLLPPLAERSKRERKKAFEKRFKRTSFYFAVEVSLKQIESNLFSWNINHENLVKAFLFFSSLLIASTNAVCTNKDSKCLQHDWNWQTLNKNEICCTFEWATANREKRCIKRFERWENCVLV